MTSSDGEEPGGPDTRPGRDYAEETVAERAVGLSRRGNGFGGAMQIWKQLTAGELIDGCSPGRRDLALHQVGEAGDPFRGLGLHGGTDLRP